LEYISLPVELFYAGGKGTRRRLEDRILVERLLQGDPAAQAEFDRSYRQRLYQACCQLLGYNDKDAEDVVQDTFLAAYDNLHTFEFRSSFYRWLHQIAMYKCFRVIRGRKRQVASLSEELEGFAAGDSAARHADTEESRRLQVLAEAVRSEREALGEPCRTMLRKRDEEDLTYGQLADELKIPVGTVMSRLSRCMEALRNRLAKRWKGGLS
jgi:RNA polymerase sigma-70 factor (ECF subfamily)